MNKAKDIDNILDECLERIIAGGETVEECLSAYPGHAAELEPLLRTAVSAKMAMQISPSAEFRERAGHRFQAALREMETQQSRGFFGWQPRLVMPLAALAVILVGGSTVAAASGSLPDEPLYQVKLATEAVRLAFTPSEIGKAELYVKLADERVDEIIEMAAAGKVPYVESTTQRLNGQLLAVSNNLGISDDAGPQDAQAVLEASPRMMMLEEAPADVSAPVPAMAPAETGVMENGMTASSPVPAPENNGVTAEVAAPEIVKSPPAGAGGEWEPATEPAAGSYEAASAEQEAPLPPVPAPAEAPGLLPQLTTPGKVLIKDADEWQEPYSTLDPETALSIVISQHAAENTVALQEIIDRVPEAARPALLRALEVAVSGYENALNKLR